MAIYVNKMGHILLLAVKNLARRGFKIYMAIHVEKTGQK